MHMRYPRLRADFVPAVVTEDGQDQLFLLGESRRLLVDDPVAAELAGLLDGTRDVGTVAAELDPRHSFGAVVRALRRFEALGVLTEGAAETSETTAAGWDALGVEPGRAANPQSLPTIHFIGLNDTVNGRPAEPDAITVRSEEHTSELQSRGHLVCRLLLEKKNS